MEAIYKYQLPLGRAKIKIPMPIGAKVLSASFQGTALCIWAKVDTDAMSEMKEFKVYGTGHDIPLHESICISFIKTCLLDSGLVFHVFELNKEKS